MGEVVASGRGKKIAQFESTQGLCKEDGIIWRTRIRRIPTSMSMK